MVVRHKEGMRIGSKELKEGKERRRKEIKT